MTQYGPVGDFPVKGKIVCVTGGGSGIGFSLATLCHTNGARILIGDLRLTSEAEEYISKVPAGEFVFQKCDVSKWNDLHDLISASVEKFGEVPDVYVPSAGIFEPPWSNFWDDEEDSYKTLQINVAHPLKLTRLAMRALVGAEKQGVVVLVASTAGVRGNYLACLYASSKHAVLGFAKSMGMADSEEGVKIVCMLPGTVSSPLWHNRTDGYREWTKFTDRKHLQTSDIAEVMLKMIESKDYEGGTCVIKTPFEEKISEVGYTQQVAKLKEYDPSPRPDADNERAKSALAKERGKKWT